MVAVHPFAKAYVLLATLCTCLASPTKRWQQEGDAPSLWDAAAFDGEEWLNKQVQTVPMVSTEEYDYVNYEDDDDSEDGTDNVHEGNPEFLYLPRKDNHLVMQDEGASEESSQIKVRHTGRSTPDGAPEDNSIIEDEVSVSHPVEFIMDDDDESDDISFDTRPRDEGAKVLADREAIDQDDDNDEEEDDVFEDPEEDAAEIIYGDHVFLY